MNLQMEAELPYPEPADLTGEVRKIEERARFHGTYSNVWLGRLRNNEKVAIKDIIVLAGKSAASMRRKVNRERLLWAAMCHPNVAPLYGYVEDSVFGPFGALISPWYEFGDASTFFQLNGSALDAGQRVDIWRGVVNGIHYLHHFDPPIIHGDIKPGNVLIADNLEPKICDFGLSRIFLEEGHTGLTTTSEHTGTERYLAYELVATEDDIPSKASDVWALGCLGLEFIYSILPYANRRNNRGGWITIDITNGILPAVPTQELVQGSNDAILWELFQQCWDMQAESRPSTSNIMVCLHTLALEATLPTDVVAESFAFSGERSPAHTTALRDSSPRSQELIYVIDELESSVASGKVATERGNPETVRSRGYSLPRATNGQNHPGSYFTRSNNHGRTRLGNGAGTSSESDKSRSSPSLALNSEQGASWTSWGTGSRRSLPQTRKFNKPTEASGSKSWASHSNPSQHRSVSHQYTFWVPPEDHEINESRSPRTQRAYSGSSNSTVSTNSTTSTLEDAIPHTPPQYPPIFPGKTSAAQKVILEDPFGDSDDEFPEHTLLARSRRIVEQSTPLAPPVIVTTNIETRPVNFIHHPPLDDNPPAVPIKDRSPAMTAIRSLTSNAPYSSLVNHNGSSTSHHSPSASRAQFRSAFPSGENGDYRGHGAQEDWSSKRNYPEDVVNPWPLSNSPSHVPARDPPVSKRNASNRRSILSILKAPTVKPVPLPPPKPRP